MYASVCDLRKDFPWWLLYIHIYIYIYISYLILVYNVYIYIGTGSVPRATSRTTVFFYYFVFLDVQRTNRQYTTNASIYYYNIMIIVIIIVLRIDNVTAAAVVSFVSILSFTPSYVVVCTILYYNKLLLKNIHYLCTTYRYDDESTRNLPTLI